MMAVRFWGNASATIAPVNQDCFSSSQGRWGACSRSG